MPKTHWTPEERATAIGIGFTRGGSVASEVTTIPRRTISRWLHQDGNDPVVASAILETERAVVDKLWRAVTEGVDLVTAGLRDPKARLGDKARALEVLATQHALLSGRVTSRNAHVDEGGGVSADDADRLADWLEARLFEGNDPAAIIEAARPQLTGGSERVE